MKKKYEERPESTAVLTSKIRALQAEIREMAHVQATATHENDLHCKRKECVEIKQNLETTTSQLHAAAKKVRDHYSQILTLSKKYNKFWREQGSYEVESIDGLANYECHYEDDLPLVFRLFEKLKTGLSSS